MSVRKIDADNDWMWGRGRNDYIVNEGQIQQSIKTNLQSFLGDCFFDTLSGLDWFNLLGSKNEAGIKLAISASILNTPGVIKLNEISVLFRETRNLLIEYEVTTVYSTVVSDQVEIGA